MFQRFNHHGKSTSQVILGSAAKLVLNYVDRNIYIAPIPGWLKGTLWTSGPGTFDLEKGSYKSWLDGLAMITKVEIGSESVKLSSKHVHTVNYKKAVKAKHPVIPGLMTPPGDDDAKGFFSKFMPFVNSKHLIQYYLVMPTYS